MPQTILGGAMPNVAENADKSWWSFRHFNPRTSEDPRLSYITAYKRAYRDALADSTSFAGLQADVQRLADLLEEGRIDREALLMVAEDMP